MADDKFVIEDNATPYLQYMIQAGPEQVSKAMKSLGWYMQKEIKAAIKTQSPAGTKWKQFMDPRIRAQLEGKSARPMLSVLANHEKGWRRKYAQNDEGKSVRYQPFGKLQRAIGYQFDKKSQTLMVGYLSASALKLGTMMEEGFTKDVTEQMQKFFYAHGVPIKKEQIKVSARPLMAPMKKKLLPEAVPYIEGKLQEYFDNNSMHFNTSSRKYKVFSK